VLQRGSVLAEGPYEEVSKNPQVLEAYMGSDMTTPTTAGRASMTSAFTPRRRNAADPRPARLLRRVAHPARRRPHVRRGEVVTLLGRNGSGRTTTLKRHHGA
jgi:ABC-type sugar transport system ATPase subunit